MSAADTPLWTGPHRHHWLPDGRAVEVCANCPAARPRSRVERRFSWLVLALGLLAAAGIWIGIERSDGPLTLATCSSFGAHAHGSRSGC